jgi:MFS family permease
MSKGTTLQAFQVRDFRLYWLGLASQVSGQHMFQFTLGWLAFEISGSQAQLGLIHLSGFVPQAALTLLGGVLADRWDPRKLIGFAQSICAVAFLILGVLALFDRAQMWHLAIASFLLGLSNSIDEPSRAAFFPRLIPRTHLRSAVPLISMAFGGARIMAPSIAGFLIAAWGAHTSFLASAVMVSMMLAVLCLVRPGVGHAPSHGSLLNDFTDSVRYVRSNEVFSNVIVAALLNATFLMGYAYVMPVFAKDLLEVDSRGLGTLLSAAGIGALCGLLSYARLQARFTPRNVMVGSLTLYSLALLGVAVSHWFWLSVALLALTGLSQAYFMTAAQVTIQTLVDESYRGRVMGIFTLVWSLLFLSGFLLNFAGALVGPRTALGGAAVIVLCYVWLSLARSSALRRLSFAPRPS